MSFVHANRPGASSRTLDLAAIIRGVPSASAIVYSDRLGGGSTIDLRPREDGEAWEIDDVDIPADKSIRFVCDAPMQTRIKNVGARGYTLVKAGWRSVVFENLVFEGGGIAYEAGVRRHQAITGCLFQDITTGPAVRTLGESVIDVRISRTWFNKCAGGISIPYPNSDLWVIDHCIFNRNTSTDLEIGSSGVTAIDCNFEMRPTSASTKPHVNITFGLCDLVRLRFGPEVESTTYGPPQYPIVVGPIGGQGAGTIAGVLIDSCRFYGMNPFGTSSATQAKAAIHMAKALSQSEIRGGLWRKYDTGFIHEDYASGSPRDNLLIVPRKDSIYNDRPLFSSRARGWHVAGEIC